ncbi:MAG: alpha/beta hydrolase [Desulfobacteraceae bacterium]|nr:MAG: alpha/beta hydrolase [Desulfobacteraceae bacterium]
MHIIFKLAAALVLIYFAYCGLIFILQRQVLFPRYMIENIAQEKVPVPGIQKIILETGSGKVEAWYMPPVSDSAGKPAPAVIFAHGNGELIDFWPEELRGFAKLGVGVLLVEYPGYGRSEGYPSQNSITDSFVSAYDFITAENGVDPSRIVFLGRSIGGGAVCALSKIRPCAALIIMSTFISVRSFAPKYFVPGFLMRDPFDNLEAVKAYSGPVLIIHGKRDEIIPFSHGVGLSKAARNSKMIAYDCGHNDCPPDPLLFWEDIEYFLKKSGII